MTFRRNFTVGSEEKLQVEIARLKHQLAIAEGMAQNYFETCERLRAALKRIAEGNIDPWGYTRIAKDALGVNEQLTK